MGVKTSLERLFINFRTCLLDSIMEYLDVIENAMVTTSIKPFTNVAHASVLFDKILINRIMNNENFIELN